MDTGQDWIRHSRGITDQYLEARLSKLTADERRTLVKLVNKIFEDEKSPEGYSPEM